MANRVKGKLTGMISKVIRTQMVRSPEDHSAKVGLKCIRISETEGMVLV